MKVNYFSPASKMEVTRILLLAGWLTLSLSPTLGKADCGRADWKEQRAVKLASDLKIVSVTWMSGDVKKHGDPCSGDECTKSTVSVHYFHDASKKKEYLVISDLTRALKCENQKCECAENGTQGVQMDGVTLCIKKEAIEKHKECIHHAECKDTDLSCVYEAIGETNGDCGEIEDMRRFCSAARIIFPTTTTFFSFIIMIQLFI